MHNYIKKKFPNKTPCHWMMQAALCVFVCVGFGLKGCECVFG